MTPIITTALLSLINRPTAPGRWSPGAHSEMSELDWTGWGAMRPCFSSPPGESLDDALWFACEALHALMRQQMRSMGKSTLC